MAFKTQEIPFTVEAHVHIDSTKQFTTVAVELSQGPNQWVGLGTAKRSAEDEYNEDTGITLATARAFADLAEDLEAEARKLV